MPEAIAATAAAALPLAESSARGLPVRWQGLPMLVSAQTVVLIVGSFPGAASLRAAQYYAHPRNHFWPILQALWPRHPLPPAGPKAYPARCDWLLARGLGLWDVYASCERQGSLDSRIRNPQTNDFALVHGRCPRLAAVAHNGGESFRHAGMVLGGMQARPGVQVTPVAAIRLPSTSPANAGWSFERKLAAWAKLMSAHHLL